MIPEYQQFLAGKEIKAADRGIANVPALGKHLFPFQRHCVEFALRKGCAGIYLDTGLGKTLVQLEWAKRALEASMLPMALILTPLAVARQIEAEAHRFGYDARVIREQSEAIIGINICNYDRIDKLQPPQFGVVSLDEASILKGFNGKTRRKLDEMFARHCWKLCATATPAPNDHMELGQQAEFLSVMPSNEMLMRWFIADQTEMGRYRIKRHGARAFFDWMASWCRMAEKPSDLGDNDSDFTLPELKIIRHKARNSKIETGGGDGLFAALAMSATTMHDVKRQTSEARAESAAALIAAEPNEPWIIWCDTNNEADWLRVAIPKSVEVRGSQKIEEKEDKLAAFADGSVKRLISKPSICGHGLNWQHCARMLFVGRSYSYEVWYQAVRRCWRYGQKRPVHVHLIVAEGEDTIGRIIERKEQDHLRLKRSMQEAMWRAMGLSANIKQFYNPTHLSETPPWLKSVA